MIIASRREYAARAAVRSRERLRNPGRFQTAGRTRVERAPAKARSGRKPRFGANRPTPGKLVAACGGAEGVSTAFAAIQQPVSRTGTPTVPVNPDAGQAAICFA